MRKELEFKGGSFAFGIDRVNGLFVQKTTLDAEGNIEDIQNISQFFSFSLLAYSKSAVLNLIPEEIKEAVLGSPLVEYSETPIELSIYIDDYPVGNVSTFADWLDKFDVDYDHSVVYCIEVQDHNDMTILDNVYTIITG
ncbi:hypothetical protein D7X33_17760 [Butyricicoccus sp. 1XD8-22]|nr:hypothetical protein D7X33_17760 [Butyricicoccus sp. 1XD8-22]